MPKECSRPAPSFAACMMPPPPPVMTIMPFSRMSSAQRRAWRYWGCSGGVRAEPKTQTLRTAL